MNSSRYTHLLTTRVLAIDPFYKGFGFALLEGPNSLVDWGLKHQELKTATPALEEVTDLINLYHPEVLVMENCENATVRRSERSVQLIHDIGILARQYSVSTRLLSREQIRDTFCVFTKYDISTAISKHFPELEPKLPPLRKAWQSEDTRMNIFDAVALALTYFYKPTGD